MKDSTNFAEPIKTLSICDEAMLSFDVDSLFTNVPIDEALWIIEKKLRNDPKLADRTPLTIEQILQALQMCLRSIFFLYNGQFYEQIDGAAMGSPVSPVAANLFMEHFETKALVEYYDPPRM